MKIDDQKAFLDLAQKMEYEVSGIGLPQGGIMPGMAQASALAQNPDGSVTATETTVIMLVKKTTLAAK